MYIEKIRLENFKSIYDPLELNFNDIKGMWRILGNVGAGKTTIGEGILFSLFGTVNNKNNGALISWGRKHGRVELWCRSRGHALYIRREMNAYGQSPVYVEVDGEELMFTDKRDAQSQLENEYYDISRPTVELTCIISFNNFKSLTSLNTKDTKTFLDSSLGLELLNDYAQHCKEFQGEVQRQIIGVNSEIDGYTYQIDQINSLAEQMVVEDSKEVLQANITKLTQQIHDLDADILSKQRLHKDETEGLVKDISSIETRGKILAKEIAFIERGVCPTCGAPIDATNLPTKKSEKEKLANEYRNLQTQKLSKDKTYQEQYDQYKTSINKLKNEVSSLQNNITILAERERYNDISQTEITNLQCKVEKLAKKLTNLKNSDNEWATIYNIITTTVRTKIISAFVNSLNKNLGLYASILHLPYSVSFDQDFKCSLTLASSGQVVPTTSLSTGQLKIVDMITILGVLGTITRNSGINVLFLDELFSNLDAGLRIAMCSLLYKTKKEDQTIFIISHHDIDMSVFNGLIEVELKPIQQEFHSNISINYYKQ